VVEGTVLVVGVVEVAGTVLEPAGMVVPTPGTVLDVAPATVVVVEVVPGTDVDDVEAALAPTTVVVVAPATVVVVAPATVVVVLPATVVDVDVVVLPATVVDVECSGAGSAECADVEVEAITTNAMIGARTPTDRTRVRTVGNTAAP
jgi:hypothetical protein